MGAGAKPTATASCSYLMKMAAATSHAVLYGLILCLNPVTSSLTACSVCGNNILSQSKSKARIMEDKAEKLFNAYVSELELQPYVSICDEPVAWFPTNLTKLPEREMLKEIYTTLLNLGTTFILMIEQQKALNSESSLVENLNLEERNIKGFQSNIFCCLCMKKALSDDISLVDIPSTSDVFQQKCEGCRVLKSYLKFIKEVIVGLEGIKKEGNKKQRSRKRKLIRAPLHYKTALHSFLNK
ncbi:oncostatin-M-like [Microcaecilia unicolor]|uniref:Leukemia inhibitory factor n=1 Tax=Microcaecilia unicolor TaxID=1415580 RepID=A0A6P7ZFA5_9AMPH|nr:oncostatin-M-like [Microcaecilia unicolor]